MSSQSKAGWLELFYDLIFAACTLIIFMAMKQDFAVENQWWLSFVVLLLFSIWLMTTLALNRLRDQSTWVRFLVFAQMGALIITVFIAVQTSSVDDNLGLFFLALILLTLGFLARTVAREVGTPAELQRYAGWGAFIAALIIGVNAFTPESFNIFAMAFAFLVILVGYFLFFLPRMDRQMPVDREHLGERLAQLLLIVIGESFLEIAIGFQLGGRPNVLGIVLVVFLLGLTWAQYFDVLWNRGTPTGARLLLLYLLGHAIALLGIGTASLSLSSVAVSKEGAILDSLYGTELTYSLVLTYLGFTVIALSLRPWSPRVVGILGGVTVVLAAIGVVSQTFTELNERVMAIIVGVVLLVSVILSTGAVRLERRSSSDR
jgi:low temperature requirement protein LtrA